MPRKDFNLIKGVRPFLETSTPQQKLKVITDTALFKPNRRVQKLLEKEKKQGKEPILGVDKCPVFKCEFLVTTGGETLEQHYGKAHQDLADLGLTLQGSGGRGQGQAVIKDTLLAQLLVFIFTNKGQLKRLHTDYEKELETKLKSQLKKQN